MADLRSIQRGARNGVLGYTANLYEFDKPMWSSVSPKWAFDDATLDRTAATFYNADHVAIVIHDCRWCISQANGESQYDDLEPKLGSDPVITVPAITISRDFDGANADGSSHCKEITGKYSHQIFNGIGPQCPARGAAAILPRDHRCRRL